MRRAARLAALVAALASATPALASPNAFWMFGWRMDYNHGTGGFADAACVSRCGPSACSATASRVPRETYPEPAALNQVELALSEPVEQFPGGIGQ